MTATPRSRHAVFVRATAGGGGIATLLLDGRDSIALLAPFFHARRRKPLQDFRAGDVLFGRLETLSRASVDEVILAPLGKSESPTGNEQLELSCHGGAGALLAVEELLLEAGFSRGRETELLERAHLNGKLSLIALEARRLLARAATARQADFLLCSSELQQNWERLGFEMAFGMRNSRRAGTGGAGVAWREKISAAAREALALWPSANNLLRQHHVAILGPVNAGKSTLANRLARAERNITSALPGTTLDRLDLLISLRGLNLVLSDTAGLRALEPSPDSLAGPRREWERDRNDVENEREGQRRALLAAHSAELRLLVLDGSQPPGDAETGLLAKMADEEMKTLLVLNKCDLGVDESAAGLGFLAGAEPLVISAQSGQGLEKLESAIENAFLSRAPIAGAPFTQRQADLLEQLGGNLQQGREAAETLPLLRRLVGTRPDTAELARALEE